MHAHKWKRGAEETEATVKEIRRKVGQIAPAYNNGALQYLPDGKEQLSRLSDDLAAPAG